MAMVREAFCLIQMAINVTRSPTVKAMAADREKVKNKPAANKMSTSERTCRSFRDVALIIKATPNNNATNKNPAAIFG